MRIKIISILMILIFNPVLLFAHGYGSDGWFHHMGNGWGGHMGFMGGGWLMILWIGILLVVLFGIVRWATGFRGISPGVEGVETILNERFTRGEITRE